MITQMIEIIDDINYPKTWKSKVSVLHSDSKAALETPNLFSDMQLRTNWPVTYRGRGL